MKVEYLKEVEGLKNIYSKFLENGATVEGEVMHFTDSVVEKVNESYIKDGLSEEDAKYITKYFIRIYSIDN